MTSRPVIEVLGYRWLSSRPNSACRQCASLHGQEFFYRPKGGQNSVEDMPDPPLHPNCRCHVQSITKTWAEWEDVGGAQLYMDGGKEFRGGGWGNNGRELNDGPVYEKWCGQYWSGGRDTRDPRAVGPRDTFPSDDMDAACQGHDYCYDLFDEDECDRKLVKDLESLSEDPNMWRYPPDKDKAEKAEKFRRWTIRWFKWQVYSRQNLLRGLQKDIPA